MKVITRAIPHSMYGCGKPNPKYETGSVATSLGKVLCIPMTLNIGRNNLLTILLLSEFVIASEGNPYRIEAHNTPRKPFQATLREISDVRTLCIISECDSIISSICQKFSPVKFYHTPIIFLGSFAGRLNIR